MELVIRMRTISRTLVFVASAIVWLIILTLVNNAFLRTSDIAVVVGAIVLGILQTVALAAFLRI